MLVKCANTSMKQTAKCNCTGHSEQSAVQCKLCTAQ